MGKILGTKYHTQVNNKILPFVTCGVTSLAMVLDWLNIKYGTTFECDDDKVLEILNSQPIIDIAKQMIKNGTLDASALEYRVDDPNTKVEESKFTHLNNFKETLVVAGNHITNKMFLFKEEYLSIDQIKKSIDNDMPVIISAKFTKSGHFIVIVGYDNQRNWIVDDPYGNWNKGYKNTLGEGAKLSYDIQSVDAIFTFKEIIKGITYYQSITVVPNFEKI